MGARNFAETLPSQTNNVAPASSLILVEPRSVGVSPKIPQRGERQLWIFTEARPTPQESASTFNGSAQYLFEFPYGSTDQVGSFSGSRPRGRSQQQKAQM